MALSDSSANVTIPSAHVVGNMFVESYYSILKTHPEEVHKFYKECSVLSRPGSSGTMQSVTTIHAIDEMVMSLEYKSYLVEIKTVDAQHSYKDGVIVLVTGLLIGEDIPVQKFTQSFFLAPMEMEHGYFVLNDVFRFVSDDPLGEMNCIVVNGSDATGARSPSTSVDATDSPLDATPNNLTVLPEENKSCTEAHEPFENAHIEIHDIQESVSPVNQSSSTLEVDRPSASSQYQEETPTKKSYASIVKVPRSTLASPCTSVPTVKAQTITGSIDKQHVKQSVVASPVTKGKVVPVANVQTSSGDVEKQTIQKPVAPASIPHPESSTSDKNGVAENNGSTDASEGFSIYIRNLPLNATPALVESEFKKFGAIKPSGIQVRNHKQYGYCFGFVEFEALTSMESAIQASVIIGGRRIVVEEKKTTTRVGANGASIISNIGGGRGRFPMPRDGFRNDGFRGYGTRSDGFGDAGMWNDGFRGRGGYVGGQGYGRNDFRGRGEFFNRGRGGNRAAEGYHRVGRPVMNRMAVTAA